jgi:hypothetical protein
MSTEAKPRRPIAPMRIDQAEPEYIIGVDLGFSQDYTALAIAERHGLKKPEYRIRHLKRFELMTKYQEVAAEVKRMMENEALAAFDKHLVLDATGVGRPVVEMFEDAGLEPVAITITSGFEMTRVKDRAEYRVPKADLMSSMQMVVQGARLKVSPKLRLARTFIEEAKNFKIKITEDKNATYEAWRSRDHDDLVLSVAMLLWYGETQLLTVAGDTTEEKRRKRRQLRRANQDRRYYGDYGPRRKKNGAI